MRTPLILGVLAVASLGATFATQEQVAIELPTYTPEQRWERASSQVAVSFVLGIAYAKSMGQSVEEYGEFACRLFAPGWGEPGSGSLNVIRGVNRNLMMFVGTESEITATSENSVTARFNRPWAQYFGEDKTWYGVTMDEFETLLRVFHVKLAEYLGLGFEYRTEGDWTYYTFSLKK